jgi:hypothetical protein
VYQRSSLSLAETCIISDGFAGSYVVYKEFNVSCWNMDICDRSFSMRNGELGSYVMMENGLLST